MPDPAIVLERFANAVNDALSSRNDIAIIRGDIDEEDEFPVVAISAGSVEKSILSRELWQNDFTVYLDIYLRDTDKAYFDDITAISNLLVNGISQSAEFDLPGIFKIENTDQQEPDRSGEGTEYSSRTRLEWLIEYHTPR